MTDSRSYPASEDERRQRLLDSGEWVERLLACGHTVTFDVQKDNPRRGDVRYCYECRCHAEVVYAAVVKGEAVNVIDVLARHVLAQRRLAVAFNGLTEVTQAFAVASWRWKVRFISTAPQKEVKRVARLFGWPDSDLEGRRES